MYNFYLNRQLTLSVIQTLDTSFATISTRNLSSSLHYLDVRFVLNR